MGWWLVDEPNDSARSTPQVRQSFGAAARSMAPGDAATLRGLRVRVGFGRGHLLEIVATSSGSQGTLRDPCDAIEELLVRQLGSEIVDAWLGSIEHAPSTRSPRTLHVLQPEGGISGFFPVEHLATRIVDGVESLRAGLPDLPCHQRFADEPWVVFELDPIISGSPRENDSLPQEDLVMASTWMPEMLRSLLRGDPFYSGRFSRCGELFCYLELEDGALGERERLAERHRLEDTLNSALSRAGLGCVVGTGMGVARSYLDLALLEPKRSVSLLKSLIRRQSVGRIRLTPADSHHALESIEMNPP